MKRTMWIVLLIGVVAGFLGRHALGNALQPAGDVPGAPLVGLAPEGIPAPVGPYSPAIRAGEWLFISGQIGLDAESGLLVEGGVVAQTRQVLAHLETLLKAAGADFDRVVSATVYLADLDDFARFNQEYARVFTTTPPTRATVQVGRLPREAAVEIAMIAWIPPR